VTALRSDHARAAYDAFAPVYDMFTAGHDQAAWTGAILELAEDAGLPGRRLLDVGCGTGSAIPPMLDRGFAVRGVDISAAMIERARQKLGPDVELSVADMRDLPVLGSFDLVWSLCDSVNYLQSEAELAAAFHGFRRNLAPGGVVAFDVDSLATVRSLYSSLLVMPGDDVVLVFEGRSAPDLPSGASAEAWLDRLTPDAEPWWSRVRGVHHQRHHPEAVIRRALEAAGLAWVGVWGTEQDGAREQPFDDLRHNKAVYIARASAPEEQGR
jgi:SAM-dependent methyltransferase